MTMALSSSIQHLKVRPNYEVSVTFLQQMNTNAYIYTDVSQRVDRNYLLVNCTEVLRARYGHDSNVVCFALDDVHELVERRRCRFCCVDNMRITKVDGQCLRNEVVSKNQAALQRGQRQGRGQVLLGNTQKQKFQRHFREF